MLQHNKNARQRYDSHLQKNRQAAATCKRSTKTYCRIKDKGHWRVNIGCFVFVEGAKKKNDLSLVFAANASKRKAEETNQDMTKLEETLLLLKKKQKSI